MRQVTAVRQRHPEDRVAGREGGEEHRLVRLRAGMRLHVGRLGAEERLHPVEREPLGDVDALAAAVIALAGIALGVLVGEHRALRLEHGPAHVVLGGDQLDVRLLPLALGDDGGPQLGVGLGEGERVAGHGESDGKGVE